MSRETAIFVANACQILTIMISLAAYIPQWVKLIRSRSSRDISSYSWLLWIISSALALFYASVQYQVNGKGLPLVCSSLATFCCIVCTLTLSLYFRNSAD